ncbi:MAG: ABC transporter ATP-binding protein, partial [Syntrophaceae bacterium]|nr:ABC transporter ATP-binding protein [Syntrophaceae bacterium]
MAQIEMDGVAHSYLRHPEKDADYAIKTIANIWDDGGAYALLGPSGCGKTTLLNIISGLLTPTRGRVLYNGTDVTALPPEKRNIAQVFQFPVLYDTMTVYENLA